MKRLTELEGEFLKVYEKLDISKKLELISELEKQVAEPDIWKDVAVATEKNQELARLSDEVQPWELLRTQISDLRELMGMAEEDLKDEVKGQIEAMEAQFEELKKVV